MLTTDKLLTNTQDFGGWSADSSRPDYACPAYQEMCARWQLVHDARGGTVEIRRKAEFYLPRFEAELIPDWQARVNMTFMNDHYATTVVEHTGLVFAQPIKLGDDVPQEIRDICEDIDGSGNHLDVFAETAFDSALHLGHAVLFTDYPVSDAIKNKKQQTASKIRPYVSLFHADDVLSWQTVVFGGVEKLVQVVLRERLTVPQGEFGTQEIVQYKEIKQAVTYDEFTGRATSLGAITWRAWRFKKKQGSVPANTRPEFEPAGEGWITGPDHICARVVYGGEKLGFLHTKPHAHGLALTNIEETQVGSDYASCMHKCNVPTPIFIGRTPRVPGEKAVQMGQGIDIPIGGDAKILEPTGAALGATRDRLNDLRNQMRRQGASSADDMDGKIMTAREAAIVARQRNAKLSRAARSLQDALEGVFMDIAAFMNLKPVTSKDKKKANAPQKAGGSVIISRDFSGPQIDPAYLQVLVTAYREGALPLDALMFALEHGKLPDDFSAEDAALKLIADQLALADAENAAAIDLAKNPLPPITPPNKPPPKRTP